MKPTICHNCGKEGHKSTYCQEEKIDRMELAKITQNIGIGHEKVKCFNCSQFGHYANMCPIKKEKASEDAYPAFNRIDMIQMPPPDDRINRNNSSKPDSTDKLKKTVFTNVDLKNLQNMPFNESDINQAIKDLAQRISTK